MQVTNPRRGPRPGIIFLAYFFLALAETAATIACATMGMMAMMILTTFGFMLFLRFGFSAGHLALRTHQTNGAVHFGQTTAMDCTGGFGPGRRVARHRTFKRGFVESRKRVLVSFRNR